MFEEKREIRVFRVTVKKVIERLLEIKDCPLKNFQKSVIEKFDGYDYEDIEELVGFDTWQDISNNGEYELKIKINHEHAYEFTLYLKNQDSLITIYNVL